MIGYVMVGTNDLARATEYYDAVMAPLGLVNVGGDSQFVAYAPTDDREKIEFYVTQPFNGEPATVGNGTMISLLVDSRAAVDEYHCIALENGGVCEGKPGPRPADADVYYAYARDLDGNKICVYTESMN